MELTQILKICKDCLCEKPIEKFQKSTRVCISCRNKKYYKKDYFQEYYKEHSDKIILDSFQRYNSVEKLKHPNPVGRPKKQTQTI